MDGDRSFMRCGPSVGQPHLACFGFNVIQPRHPLRAQVEDFIAERYRAAFGAQVTSFMPTLFALIDEQSNVISAAGMRRGSEGPLFVEQYLDAPAEVVLAERFATPVARSRLVEIGHLSGLGSGNGRRLFPLLAQCLDAEGVDWAVFAATQALRGQFDRMGVRPVPLAPARAERLGPAAAAWGSYYDTDPWVVGGPLHLGQHLLVSAP